VDPTQIFPHGYVFAGVTFEVTSGVPQSLLVTIIFDLLEYNRPIAEDKTNFSLWRFDNNSYSWVAPGCMSGTNSSGAAMDYNATTKVLSFAGDLCAGNGQLVVLHANTHGQGINSVEENIVGSLGDVFYGQNLTNTSSDQDAVDANATRLINLAVVRTVGNIAELIGQELTAEDPEGVIQTAKISMTASKLPEGKLQGVVLNVPGDNAPSLLLPDLTPACIPWSMWVPTNSSSGNSSIANNSTNSTLSVGSNATLPDDNNSTIPFGSNSTSNDTLRDKSHNGKWIMGCSPPPPTGEVTTALASFTDNPYSFDTNTTIASSVITFSMKDKNGTEIDTSAVTADNPLRLSIPTPDAQGNCELPLC